MNNSNTRTAAFFLIPFVLALTTSTAGAGVPTLTTAAATAGYGLSMFADGFRTDSGVGPLGIAFLPGGQVMTTDYPGNVYILPNDSDGQTVGAAVTTYANHDAIQLAHLGGSLYMTQQASGKVVKIDNNGGLVSEVVDGIDWATGITASAVNNKLYVSGVGGNAGLWVVDPAGSKSQLRSGVFDGVSVSADGLTLYAETGGHIIGIRLADNTEVFNSGYIAGVDGTELGYGALAGKIFANTNYGELWAVDLANPADKTLLVSGGSRGDFVTADPNGTLLFTQTNDIWRLTAPSGGCIGAACNNAVPEPATLPLLLLGALGMAYLGRRTS